MFQFDPRSRVIEVHGNYGGAPFYVHEDFLRQPFAGYGAMIDHALATGGRATIRLNLSQGALAEWTKWLYGTKMGDPNADTPDIVYLPPLLELYEYSHIQFRPEVDHKCANACLDAMLVILEYDLETAEDINIFGRGNVPTLVDFVTRLDRCNGKGTQMLVDLITHGKWSPLIVSEMIQMIEPVPTLAGFFHKLSYAAAIAHVEDFNILAPEDFQLDQDEMPEIPIIDSPHAYHSRREGEALCCGRQAPPPAFAPGFALGVAPRVAPGVAPGFAPGFALAPMKREPHN